MRKTVIWLLLVMICVLSACSSQEKVERYVYPVTLESEQWASLSGHSEQIDVCRIDQKTIDQLSTQQLVYAVLDYPLIMDMFAWDTYKMGYSALTDYCDALIALEHREDAPQTILKVYQTLPTLKAGNVDLEAMMDLYTLEVIIAQPVYYEALSDQEKETLNRAVEKKYTSIDPSECRNMFDVALNEHFYD